MRLPTVSLLYLVRVGVVDSAISTEDFGVGRDPYACQFLGEVDERVGRCISDAWTPLKMSFKRFPLRAFSGRIYSEFLGEFKCPEFPTVEVRYYSLGFVSVWVKVVSYLRDLCKLSSAWSRFTRMVGKPFISRFFGGLNGLGWKGFSMSFYSFVHLIGGENIISAPRRVLYCLTNPLGCAGVDEEYVRRHLHIERGKYAGDRFAFSGAGLVFQMMRYRGSREKCLRRKVRSMYRLAIDIALAAQAFYIGRARADFTSENLYKGLLWLSPGFWRADFYARRRSFISAYRRVTLGLRLERSFRSYKRFIVLSADFKTREKIWEVNAKARKLGLAPPVERFKAGAGLSGFPLRVLECLMYKNLAERYGVRDDRVGKLLFHLLGDKKPLYEEENRQAALQTHPFTVVRGNNQAITNKGKEAPLSAPRKEFEKAYGRRKLKIGLSARELAVLTGRKIASIYELLRSGRLPAGLVLVDYDYSNGRKIQVWRINVDHQIVKDVIWIYDAEVRRAMMDLNYL